MVKSTRPISTQWTLALAWNWFKNSHGSYKTRALQNTEVTKHGRYKTRTLQNTDVTKHGRYKTQTCIDLVLVWLIPALPSERSSSFISLSPGACIGVLVARLNPNVILFNIVYMLAHTTLKKEIAITKNKVKIFLINWRNYSSLYRQWGLKSRN